MKRALDIIFSKQRQAFMKKSYPTYQVRRDGLLRLKEALLEKSDLLEKSLSNDFGHRSIEDTRISELLPVVNHLNYTLKRLKRWMKSSTRDSGLMLSPARLKVCYQPLGVVGMMVPWNFPVMLSLSPLVTALAAGNRCMLKLSEYTPQTNRVLKHIVSACFSEAVVAVVEGEADVAVAFSKLPFDHLLFTGSTPNGKRVMAAAAENLTSLTLELGGKSPVIIAPDMPIDIAVERIIFGKCLNAGQICVAPDYIWCPEDKIKTFVSAYQKKFQSLYGTVAENPDYTNIINEHHYQRLLGLLNDAEAKGADVVCASGEGALPRSRKLATQLLTGVTPEMKVMQEEIFGPLLPVLGYTDLKHAINSINQRPRPLALYLMSFDRKLQKKIIRETHSGGVCINETVLHVAADDAPFGGIGASGMGHYHGEEGFRRLSHTKTVLQRGRFNPGKFVHPPYGRTLQKLFFKFFLR